MNLSSATKRIIRTENEHMCGKATEGEKKRPFPARACKISTISSRSASRIWNGEHSYQLISHSIRPDRSWIIALTCPHVHLGPPSQARKSSFVAQRDCALFHLNGYRVSASLGSRCPRRGSDGSEIIKVYPNDKVERRRMGDLQRR